MSEPNETLKLWEFLPVGQFHKPPEPAGEAVRKGFRSLWRRIWEAARDDQSGRAASELHAAGGGLLDRVSPQPKWDAAAEALETALAERSDDRLVPRHPIALVGPPFGGAAGALRKLAKSMKWPVFNAPSFDDVLSGGGEFVDQIESKNDKPLVFLHLEKFFLRQHDGLGLLRRLLQRLLEERKTSVVHCGSWAWAYLEKAVQIDSAVGEAITLQAFDEQRLQRWLRKRADCSVKRPIQFLQADNGLPVLPSPAGCAAHDRAEPDEEPEVTGFLKNLASFSRGNPGVALQIWRRSLGISRETEDGKSGEDVSEAQHPNTIWVTPWSSLELPGLGSAGKAELFVLNALLIHDGLGLGELCHVLGDAPVEVRQRLGRLREIGVAALENGVWGVSPVAYPGVRDYLSSEGFLVDGF